MKLVEQYYPLPDIPGMQPDEKLRVAPGGGSCQKKGKRKVEHLLKISSTLFCPVMPQERRQSRGGTVEQRLVLLEVLMGCC